jgi:hypothetical protein
MTQALFIRSLLALSMVGVFGAPIPVTAQPGWLVAPYQIGSLPTAWSSDAKKVMYLSGDPFELNNGTNVELWDYYSRHSGGKHHKTWFFEPTGVTGQYYLKNAMTGKCLSIDLSKWLGLLNGDNIIEWRCIGWPNQIWTLENLGWGHRIRSVWSRKCIEAKGFANGDNIHQWDCLPPFPYKFNQLWFGIPVADATNPPHDSGKGLLCDVCNPKKPVCNAPGAKCLITPLHQAICGQACDSANPCPQGYTCCKAKNAHQCAPTKYECDYVFVAP